MLTKHVLIVKLTKCYLYKSEITTINYLLNALQV